jgi:hypothetical protein
LTQIFLVCPSASNIITNITFASFGNPQGTPGSCATYKRGSCDLPGTVAAFMDTCLGLNGCGLVMEPQTFGGYPPTVCDYEGAMYA